MKNYLNLLTVFFFQNNPDLWSEFESQIGVVNDEFINKLSEKTTDAIQNFFVNNADPYAYGYDIDDENYGDRFTEVDKAVHQALSEKPSIRNAFPIENFSQIFGFLQSGMDSMIDAANDGLNSVQPLGGFSSDSYFLTFNYTETLEKKYGIESQKIFHIHGAGDKIWGNLADNISDATDINIDIDYTNYEYETGIDGEWDEVTGEYYQYPSNLADFEVSVTYDDGEIQKETNEIALKIEQMNSKMIKEHQLLQLECFINQIPVVEDIIVLGVSIGEVDVPYFELLNERYPDARWFVSYYSKKDLVFDNIKKLSFRDKVKLEEFGKLFN
ncbi:AbiH family protein [Streptococcus sp. S784/96/1]|uniref:AbiH family protein n=1 Tax=Streptococcus sp. S784/96/1 TaxID=2653499 RepID=UPI001387555F|nr:AbiH family protein [Streptococcus sp. S784/96/1]